MDDNLTIKQAKEILRKHLEGKGGLCPCCGQFTKAYKRKITSTMAYGLIKLNQAVNGEFHLEDKLKELDILKIVRSDFPKLRYWGLIRQLEGKRDDGSSRNGHYEITSLGRKFVNNEVSLPKYVFVYDNSPYKRTHDQQVKITQCMGSKFDYNEIMNIKN